MAHIKKMVVHGFKSFARKTEIPFDQGINVIIGANGSGKSNVSDSLCFALGRLSIKSMRAAKAKNLLFMGSKTAKPAKEAYVELVFDNCDRSFATDKEEVSLKRVIRSNGQCDYIINGEKKTRSEVIELLAHAGIDPHGYNMVLQGQIQSIVKMHPEERRKIIEEVAGISIYESRKEKSLRELEKTDSRLKEVSAVLRERTSYLNNLDKERAQALRFKELESNEKRCRATILTKRMQDKDGELNKIKNSIQEKVNQKGKISANSENMQKFLEDLSEKVEEINKHIQKSSGFEQDKLHNSIADLKAELEGLKVRKESFESRENDTKRRIEEVSKTIPELETEILGLKKKSPLMAKKSEELKKKKEELAELGEERKKLLTIKSDLNSIRELIKDKQNQLGRVSADSENVLRQLEAYSENLNYENEDVCLNALKKFKEELEEKKELIENISRKEIESEKTISVSESEIERSNKIKEDVQKIDICPLCQSKMTDEHLNHVFTSSDTKVNLAKKALEESNRLLEEAKNKKQKINNDIRNIGEKISSAEVELSNHRAFKDKKERLKELVQNEKIIKEELTKLEDRVKKLEERRSHLGSIEEKYDSKILEIEEISSRTEEDVDTTILYKERELENTMNIIKRAKSDLEEIAINLRELSESIKNKFKLLSEKEKAEDELNKKFNKMFEERNRIQKSMQEKNMELSNIQSSIRQIEDQINYLKIGKAKVDAERESLEMDLTEFEGVELLNGSINALEDRLRKTKESLSRIGSINMRALEVYENIKKEYDVVYEKVETLNKEKEDILSIIEEIDKKKKKEFMKTFRAISQIFTDNFSRLYSKGIAYLEIENKDDIFQGGVNIVVKLAKGKYFDVTSLSGGEQTLVALSLLFAIQEHKPYHFYIFDEIDAALDKRNSERLAGLLKQYMKAGQYIVITHNDAIISDSNVIYGVSMHEGISKILSLKIE